MNLRLPSSRRLRSALLYTAVFAGCATATAPRMAVPPSLRAVGERYDVNGRAGWAGGNLTFGPYTTNTVKLGWRHHSVRAPKLVNEWTERSTTRQSARFGLAVPGGATYDADCEQNVEQLRKYAPLDELDDLAPEDALIEKEVQDVYTCTIRQGARTIALRVDGESFGAATIDGVELMIFPLLEAEGGRTPKSPEPFGFVLTLEDVPQATVDLTLQPSVTLRTDLAQDRRDAVAAVSLALLLLKDMT